MARQLHNALRTGCLQRRRKGPHPFEGQGHIRQIVLISARPAEVDERAIPSHRLGDLIMVEARVQKARLWSAPWALSSFFCC